MSQTLAVSAHCAGIVGSCEVIRTNRTFLRSIYVAVEANFTNNTL